MRRPDSPTVEILAAFGVVFVLREVGGLIGLPAGLFALAAPIAARPWTLVTSVYAHAGLGHLLANAVALAVVGFALERYTTRLRFHAFVLATGMVAGVAEVIASGIVGRSAAVLGASGAILALYGYVLAGNPVTGGVLARLDLGRRAKLGIVAGLAILVVLATGGPGVALVAHAAGFVLGVGAGRLRLLRVDREHPPEDR